MRMTSNKVQSKNAKQKNIHGLTLGPWRNRNARISNHHDNDPTDKKRKGAESNRVQPKPECGTTVLVSGFSRGLRVNSEQPGRLANTEGDDIQLAEGWSLDWEVNLGVRWLTIQKRETRGISRT